MLILIRLEEKKNRFSIFKVELRFTPFRVKVERLE